MDFRTAIIYAWKYISGSTTDDNFRTTGALRNILVDNSGNYFFDKAFTDYIKSNLDILSKKYTSFKGDVVAVDTNHVHIDLTDTFNYVSLANTGNKDLYISFDNTHFFRIVSGGTRDLENVEISNIYYYGTGNTELDYLVGK